MEEEEGMRKLNGPLSVLYGGFLGFGFTMVVLLVPTTLMGKGCEHSQSTFAALQQKPAAKEDVREATVFAYCMCTKCCGDSNPNGKTSAGKDGKKFCDGAAADPKAIPFGKRVYIPGVGDKFIDDTGAKLKEALAKKGELLICFRVRTHEEVEQFKRVKLKITVLED
jgi:3D (Asp-Asp-Asp) domain-containing protein